MFELEKDLYSCLAEIYNTTELNDRVHADELDLNYDFKKNKVGIYYTINNINDNEYKDKATIDVNFYSLVENKINMLKVIDVFDKKLNGKDFKNYWITHKNVWLITLKEDELFHYVLSYTVNKY